MLRIGSSWASGDGQRFQMCVCVCARLRRPRQMLPNDTHTWRAGRATASVSAGGLGGPASPPPPRLLLGIQLWEPLLGSHLAGPRGSRGRGRRHVEQEPGPRQRVRGDALSPGCEARAQVPRLSGRGAAVGGGLGVAFRPKKEMTGARRVVVWTHGASNSL